MIKLINVSKKFAHNDFVVKDLSLEIKPRETLVLLGASGSGKTTTLKLINRLLEPTSGRILINNQDINNLDAVSLRRNMGYVFQDIGLFPHMTVEDNVAIVLRLAGVAVAQRQTITRKLLTDVHLDPKVYCKRFPSELSGGEQQRVGVARALATNPDFLLMDEPFGALDPISRYSLQNVLLHIKQTLAKTIIFVTHDIFEAVRLADRIAIMNEGRLEQVAGKKEIATAPATPFVQQLFERATDQIKDFMSLVNE